MSAAGVDMEGEARGREEEHHPWQLVVDGYMVMLEVQFVVILD
jgi:hypothetical protein